jgi:hypothetical protein
MITSEFDFKDIFGDISLYDAFQLLHFAGINRLPFRKSGYTPAELRFTSKGKDLIKINCIHPFDDLYLLVFADEKMLRKLKKLIGFR